MTIFKIGDRVRVKEDYPWHPTGYVIRKGTLGTLEKYEYSDDAFYVRFENCPVAGTPVLKTDVSLHFELVDVSHVYSNNPSIQAWLERMRPYLRK